MKINSYYNIGDCVFKISTKRKENFIDCPSCEKGFIPLKSGEGIKCPQCEGKGAISAFNRLIWFVDRPLTIGQIRFEIDAQNFKEEYMCTETGVGSGSIHKVEDLFRTIELAQEECDKRNHQEKDEWICTLCNKEYSGFYSVKSDYRYCSVHRSVRMLEKKEAEKKFAEHEQFKKDRKFEKDEIS